MNEWTDTREQREMALNIERELERLKGTFVKKPERDEWSLPVETIQVDLEQYQVEEHLWPKVCEFAGCGSKDTMTEEIFGQDLTLCRDCGDGIDRIMVEGYAAFLEWVKESLSSPARHRWRKGKGPPW